MDDGSYLVFKKTNKTIRVNTDEMTRIEQIGLLFIHLTKLIQNSILIDTEQRGKEKEQEKEKKQP